MPLDAVCQSDWGGNVNHGQASPKAPHGHYCVPILTNDQKVLGVFTLYLKHGMAQDKRQDQKQTLQWQQLPMLGSSLSPYLPRLA